MKFNEDSDQVLVIAEVAQSHQGDVDLAHAFIESVARVGVDAVKFQTHIAAAESTSNEPWRIRFGERDESRFEYWKRMEFSEEQWGGLQEHAESKGLSFYSSPFSSEAVGLLRRIGVSGWKVASGEANNCTLLPGILETGQPVFLSTGMSTIDEIDQAVERIRDAGSPFAVMQCTSMYPTPAEKVGLNLLAFYRQRYGCPVGLSDHSGTIFAGLAAAALGASVLEVHVTLSREMPGPDIPVSLTPEEIRQLISGLRFIERMRGNPVDKNAVASELADMRRLFTKSIVAASDLPEGTVLERHHLAIKKPGLGLPPGNLPEILGRRIAKSLRKDDFVIWKMLEPSKNA